MTSLNIT